MKYDFTTPLDSKQLEVVRWTQEHGDDVYKAAALFDLDPADIFYWTIQDYELQRRPLMKKGFESMSEELLAQINALYEREVNLKKIWEDSPKESEEPLKA